MDCNLKKKKSAIEKKPKMELKFDIHVGWIDRANNAGQHIDKGCSESLTLSTSQGSFHIIKL